MYSEKQLAFNYLSGVLSSPLRKSCIFFQLISGTLNNRFWWSSLLLGLDFVTVIVRHRTRLSAAWFEQLRVWIGRQSGCKQVLAWGDRDGHLIRAESRPRLRAAKTVVPGDCRGCRTSGKSWSNCWWCCHVVVRIWKQSTQGWYWNSLYKTTTKNVRMPCMLLWCNFV